jgi:hypothetical protein
VVCADLVRFTGWEKAADAADGSLLLFVSSEISLTSIDE